MYLYHMTTLDNRNWLRYHKTEVNIKIQKEILFCKQTGSYILIRSCKGPLIVALFVYCYLENQVHVFFKQHPW